MVAHSFPVLFSRPY